jgi:hypothetical protein
MPKLKNTHKIVIEQVEEKNTSNIPESENLVAWEKKV